MRDTSRFGRLRVDQCPQCEHVRFRPSVPTGVVRAHQPQKRDQPGAAARKARKIEHAPQVVIDDAIGRLVALLD